MNSWIKISPSLIFLLCMSAQASCDFISSHKKIYSLSGPVTYAFKELNLLDSRSLKGVSVFHPVQFKGKFLPGGIFLSREMTEEMKGGVVFFDESRDLARMLKERTLKAHEVKTRGLTPEEVTEKLIQELGPYLKECEIELKNLSLKTKQLSAELVASIPKNFKAVFFLGEIRNGRPPEMAMTNDGIVKWLREKGLLSTYATDLSYVNWSAKLMNELPEGTLKIGIKDSGKEMSVKLERPSKQSVNFTYPGALIPGLSQLEAWLYLIRKL